ncbi:MAG TPA: hypothetical protein PLZ57_00995 [Pseudobdellovibrionaceae bacterium]|nr:hypothetical protein [Pseudobdellovibrionaceae bacterium]
MASQAAAKTASDLNVGADHSPREGESTDQSASTESASQDRLIVLAKDVASVKSMSNFLNRRGVETFVTSQLNDAVDRLTQGWTRFVLLSVNFPHPKVELIPQLFAQSFTAETIAFGEQSDRKTAQKLTASRARNVIFGAASGPVVLMRLKQAQRQDEDPGGDVESTRSAAASDEAASEDVRVKGSAGMGLGKSAVHVKGGAKSSPNAVADSLQARQEAASRFMRALSESGAGEVGEEKAAATPELDEVLDADDESSLPTEGARATKMKSDIIIQKGARGSAPKSIADQITANASAKAAGPLVESGPGAGRELYLHQKGAKTQGKSQPHVGSPREAKSSPSIAESRPQLTPSQALLMPTRKSKVLEALQEGQLADLGQVTAMDSASRKTGNGGLVLPKPSSESKTKTSANETESRVAPGASPRAVAAVNLSGEAALSGDASVTESTQTDVEFAARTALRKVYGEPRKERDTLIEYRSVAILIVHIDSFTGTIMLAEGRGTNSSSTRLHLLEQEFLNALAERGHQIRVGDLQSMPFPNPAVAEEAFLAADMSAVSRNEEYEAGIAFLDLVPAKAVIEETADEMLKIGIEDLEPNTRMNFDVFIYLPTNAKYLKYVRQGNSISSDQSERLKSREVRHVYLDKESREDYLQHNVVKNVRQGIMKKSSS